jgi:hypothetical protein
MSKFSHSYTASIIYSFSVFQRRKTVPPKKAQEMEPMTMSPSSPVKAQYLPSFLLGEATNESNSSNLDSSNLMRSSRAQMNTVNSSRTYDPNGSQLTSPTSIYQLHHTPDYNRYTILSEYMLKIYLKTVFIVNIKIHFITKIIAICF